MEQFIKYAKSLGLDDFKIKWINNVVGSKSKTTQITTSQIEHIIDWLASDKAPTRIMRVSYDTALEQAEAWTKSQNKKGAHIKELQSDTETILDFGDGFKIVKLIGKAAFERGGFLMSHCVASYYGRDTEVYSLRDKNNMPHCTIEKDRQIKGKGNGDITHKFIDYIVKFLEFTGMKIRDSEMSNLGFEVAQNTDYIENKLYRNRYKLKNEPYILKEGVIAFYNQADLFKYLGAIQ